MVIVIIISLTPEWEWVSWVEPLEEVVRDQEGSRYLEKRKWCRGLESTLAIPQVTEAELWRQHGFDKVRTTTPSLFCPIWGPPVFSALRISQTRILKRVAIPFSRGSSQPRDQTWVSCHCRQILYHWAIREVPLSHPKSAKEPEEAWDIHLPPPYLPPRCLEIPELEKVILARPQVAKCNIAAMASDRCWRCGHLRIDIGAWQVGRHPAGPLV